MGSYKIYIDFFEKCDIAAGLPLTVTEYVVLFITAHETSLSRQIWARCNIKWDLRVVLTKN